MICARLKPEEGGFPGRAFEEGLRVSIRSVVRLSTVASECLLPQSIFALYQREALLRDLRSLREGSVLYMLLQLPPGAEAVLTRLSHASQR